MLLCSAMQVLAVSLLQVLLPNNKALHILPSTFRRRTRQLQKRAPQRQSALLPGGAAGAARAAAVPHWRRSSRHGVQAGRRQARVLVRTRQAGEAAARALYAGRWRSQTNSIFAGKHTYQCCFSAVWHPHEHDAPHAERGLS